MFRRALRHEKLLLTMARSTLLPVGEVVEEAIGRAYMAEWGGENSGGHPAAPVGLLDGRSMDPPPDAGASWCKLVWISVTWREFIPGEQSSGAIV